MPGATDVSTNKPRIETERLVLRWFEIGDLAPYYELGTDPEVIRYVGSVPFASLDAARETMETAPLRDYATYGFGRFACVWKETGEVVGFCGPKFLPDLEEVELGYRFLRNFWGKGARYRVSQGRRRLRARRSRTPTIDRPGPSGEHGVRESAREARVLSRIQGRDGVVQRRGAECLRESPRRACRRVVMQKSRWF